MRLSLPILAVLLVAPRAAVAQAGSLVWEAPPPCPDGEAVRGAVARLLGDAARALPAGPAVRAEVVALDAGGFELTLRGDATARTLRGGSCTELADAAALIVALALDPSVAAAVETAVIDEPPPPSRSEPVAGRPAAPAPGAEREPEGHASAEPAPGAPALVRVRAGAAGEAGALPSVAVGPTLAVGLDVGALRLEARGLYLPPRRADVPNHDSARGDVWLAAGSVDACTVAFDGALEGGPCGGVEIGAMHAAGSGVSTPGSATVPWAGLSAGAFAAVPVADWLALRVDVAGVLALNRPAFVIDGIPGEVHRPAVVSGRLSLGAEVRFR